MEFVVEMNRHVHGKRVLVVTNERVAPLFLDKTIDALTRGNPNVTVESVILPDGEKYKDMVSLPWILEFPVHDSDTIALLSY